MNNGRIKILSDLIPTGIVEQDAKIIPIIINNTMSDHRKNVDDMDILENYYFNKTDIAKKEKRQQEYINNKIATPFANIAVTTINAYCFANPLTLSSRNSDKQNELKQFCDLLDDDNYSEKTIIATMNSGKGGLGYKYVRPANASERAYGMFFKTVGDIDPKKTYCVYSNSLDKEKIMAINYFEKTEYDLNGDITKTYNQYNVWTTTHYWVFTDKDGDLKPQHFIVGNEDSLAYPLPYKRIPIIEYPRKQDRTSDFEIAKDLIDAYNNLLSNRIDAVQQAVDYLLLLRDIDTESKESLSKIKECIRQGILSFKSIEGATVQPEVKVLNMSLNQSEVQKLQDEITSKIEEALNIPNRETRSSGGDTGSAVESRNGFRSLENIAGLVTASAKAAENEALDVILSICKSYEDCPFKNLTINDIEIKENRNKIENLTNAANAYATLKSAGMNDTDAMVITRIVNDAISTAKKNVVYAEENARKAKLSTNDSRTVNNENENIVDQNGTSE